MLNVRMNTLDKKTNIGTIGELFVQLRLLELGVQAAPPLKDSGNDLIAIRGHAIRAIQVKTSTGLNFNRNLPDRYHILAAVQLVRIGGKFSLDASRIYLFSQTEADTVPVAFARNNNYLLSQELVDRLFKPRKLQEELIAPAGLRP